MTTGTQLGREVGVNEDLERVKLVLQRRRDINWLHQSLPKYRVSGVSQDLSTVGQIFGSPHAYMVCPECGGTSVWDDDVCSSICTTCGTLSDAAQFVLSSHTELHESSLRQFQPPSWLSSSSAPLKDIHKQGWNLAGQHKEARDRRNTVSFFYSSFPFTHHRTPFRLP